MKMDLDQERIAFSERLTQAAVSAGKDHYGERAELARHFGLSDAAVKKWFDGLAVPHKRIDALAKYYGVRSEWLRSGKGPMREVQGIDQDGNPISVKIHRVPVISEADCERYLADPKGFMQGDVEYRLAVGDLPDDAFAVKILDNSLYDRVLKGMCVVVDPRKVPGENDLVLAAINGTFVGGQLVRRDTLTIIPPNSNFRPIDLGDNPTIVGVMVQIAQQPLSV